MPSRNRPYTPFSGSIAEQVCHFFIRNPDDTLTTMDVAIKYGVSNEVDVHSSLREALRSGYLKAEFQRVTSQHRRKLFSAGPNLHTLRLRRHN